MKTRFGYTGIHAFDRGSGLNLLLDEVQVARERWSLAPRYMSFALTNACELSCPYCYASKDPAKLSLDNILRWSKELDENGCFGVGFGGGEPTLFPNFGTLCRSIHESTQLAVTFTTHGHRFNQKLSDELRGYVDFIRLSMDGIGSTYERLRGRSFTAFSEKMEIVRATSKFGVNIVINRDTLPELQDIVDFAVENGAREILLLPETNKDGTINLNSDQLSILSTWVGRNFRTSRLATSAHTIDCFEAPCLMKSVPRYASFDFMHLDAFGTLKKSAFDRVGIRLMPDDSIIGKIGQLREERSLLGESV